MQLTNQHIGRVVCGLIDQYILFLVLFSFTWNLLLSDRYLFSYYIYHLLFTNPYIWIWERPSFKPQQEIDSHHLITNQSNDHEISGSIRTGCLDSWISRGSILNLDRAGQPYAGTTPTSTFHDVSGEQPEVTVEVDSCTPPSRESHWFHSIDNSVQTPLTQRADGKIGHIHTAI